jgi:hypothetical protein
MWRYEDNKEGNMVKKIMPVIRSDLTRLAQQSSGIGNAFFDDTTPFLQTTISMGRG